MPETLQQEQAETVQSTGRQESIVSNTQDLNAYFFGGDIPQKTEEEKVETKTEEVKPEPQKTEAVQQTIPEPPKEEEDEIVDADEYLKSNLGFQTWEEAKAEVENYRKIKDKKFEPDLDEKNKTIYEYLRQGKTKELRQYLDDQEKLDHYTTAQVTDETAADIIKLGIQLSNKGLSNDEVEFHYKEQYGLPKEPKQKELESDEDFQERKAEYDEKVAAVRMRKIVAAKMALPQLEQLKYKIVLPDIFKQEVTERQPTQEELDDAKRYDDAYIQSVDSSLKNFNGVSIPVKNEVVDFSVSYEPSVEDKNAISSVLKNLVDVGYNANSIFNPLWVNADKTLNTERMIDDYYFLKNKAAILNKIANDSANKALESFVKGKKNINLNETSSTQVALTGEAKSQEDQMRDVIFGKLG